MRRTLKFEKSIDDRWYVVLPEWEGEQADLEMVCGADKLCLIAAQGENEIELTISDEAIDHADTLNLVKLTPEVGGAEYFLKRYKGVEFNLDLWLCAVTEYVFGTMPDVIWIL